MPRITVVVGGLAGEPGRAAVAELDRGRHALLHICGRKRATAAGALPGVRGTPAPPCLLPRAGERSLGSLVMVCVVTCLW
jgi:hypothetical protein